MCKYCDDIPEYPKINQFDNSLGLSKYNGEICIVSDTVDLLIHQTNSIKINYCPICGFKLDSTIVFYTDGALKTSNKTGGWAFVVVENGRIIDSSCDKVENTTNNKMELLAVMKAIVYALKHKMDNITIYTDSQYVYGCSMLGWKRKQNIDYWEVFDKLFKKLRVSIKWVKGHNTDVFNIKADSLAVKASNML